MIDKTTVKEINASVNLVEYVSTRLDLMKRGKNYFCNCPLHEDKTPSLSFNEEKNLFYCFSCGRGGGIINYLIEYEGYDFDSAVIRASELGNIDLSKVCQSRTISFLRDITEDTPANKKDEHKILDKSIYNMYSKEPITLWQEEGISQEVMDLFEIRIDKRANRIVYPVYDMGNNFINVKGRTMYSSYKELKIPKYMNYYGVNTLDYFQGYNIAKNYIKDDITIFEGIKSVMKVFSWGYKNCVSAECHSLSDEQVDILIKMGKDVTLAFDADVDYHSADIREVTDKLKRVLNVYVIEPLGLISDKESPPDRGKDVWETLYENRRRVR